MDALADLAPVRSDTDQVMAEQMIKKLKGAGYTLASSDLVTKCTCLAERLDLGAREFADEFESFALTR